MAIFMTRDGHVMDELAVSSLIGASLPTEVECRSAAIMLHTALAHGVSLADLWELSRIAVWGGGLTAAWSALHALRAGQTLTASTTRTAAPVPATAPQKALAWSEQITWDEETPTAPVAVKPARTPQAALAWSEQIIWEDDETLPAPAPASDDIVADFDRALAQMSLL